MKVTFWGVRGSVPTPDFNKMKFGGNTSCIEVEIDSRQIIFDMGTGIVPLGRKISRLIKEGKKKEIFIILSHTHWDHIQGFPFFEPIYFDKCDIYIYGPWKPNRSLKETLSIQMEYDFFPIKFSHIPARLHFFELNEGFHSILPGVTIFAKKHIHPGIAYGYRLISEGKSLVYSTDIEHFQNEIDKRVLEISDGTDFLIHDAQYKREEMSFRLGWGHSSWEQAIEVAKLSKAKSLALFHLDPERTDEEAFEIERLAKQMFQNSFVAKENNSIEI